MSCVFCKILAGSEPSSPVYSDDDVVAFMDIRPITTGHLLVVPRHHAPYLHDLSADLGAAMFRVAHRITAALRRGGQPGVNLFLADGAEAFQEVFHVHLHVLPRVRGDGFKLLGDRRTPPRVELDAAAARVRELLT